MTKVIDFTENGLYIEFVIYESGIIELSRFMPATIRERNPAKYRVICKESDYSFDAGIPPILEIQITGKSTREMHGYKHNASSASHDFKYSSHEIMEADDKKELIIHLKTEYEVYADYHMQFYEKVPIVSVWTELMNRGQQCWPIEYISSFIYQNVCGDGDKGYYEKTDIYMPFNSWSCETRWNKQNIAAMNLTGMPVDGFNCPGFGNNRYAYTGLSSWSSVEYLPMGFAHDSEMNETYFFQVESSGQWHIEYDTEPGKRLAIALSGPTEQEHGWWINLKPGDSFQTVPAAVGVVEGETDDAVAALTRYRRCIRRKNADNEKLFVVFNDYMNCLMGDPTEDKDKKIIEKAAEIGCEIFCLDCGWYDKGYWWDNVGEWIESKDRFPNGLRSLCNYARSKGMVMGLWLEIEVMGTACKLASELPDDWFICRHGKRHIDHKRYLLDFRNKEVRQYCMKVVDRLIQEYGVGYFKIDYNVTMGHGSDIDTDSDAGAILGHYRALYAWYEEIFRKYPDLVIENCGSGAMRMDYGMLKILSLQSTSDQTDYIYNSYIGTSVASACTPEQAGMWVYPYEDDTEHIIYNMVNGLLLRPYMSGMVWKLSQNGLALMKEGVSTYKSIRNDIKKATPFFPIGFNQMEDKVLAYGLQTTDTAYLAVLMPKTDTADIALGILKTVKKIEILYPSVETANRCDFSFDYQKSMLHIKMGQMVAARLFKITL